MNVNEFYANIPEADQGKVVVSDGAVTMTQAGKAAVVLLKKTADPNAELTDTAGKAMDRAALEKKLTTLKPVADVEASMML